MVDRPELTLQWVQPQQEAGGRGTSAGDGGRELQIGLLLE